MPTLAIIGAGPGLGAQVARRFAREGFSVALVSRSQGRLDDLAAQLSAEGIEARGYAADVRDAASLRSALEHASADLGPVEVLQYSPLPAKEFLRPVLETTVEDLQPAIEFSVYGLLTAVHQVLQHMRVLGGGTVLLVNGGSAVKPGAHVAGTSVAFAGETALAQMLHEALADDGIHVAQMVIPGAIEDGHPRKDPQVIAERLWEMHRDRGEFRVWADDPDSGD
ncbi:SDR family NAD(P)-dependent oxidoreductase [Nocardioides marmoraquaticus]